MATKVAPQLNRISEVIDPSTGNKLDKIKGNVISLKGEQPEDVLERTGQLPEQKIEVKPASSLEKKIEDKINSIIDKKINEIMDKLL